MGTKTQVAAKESNEKRPEWNCDICDRDFLNLTAFKSHTMAKHPEKYKLMLRSETDAKEEKKTALVPPTSRMSKRLQQQKRPTDKEITTRSDRRTVFQCPKCAKEFTAFFSATRHIKNRHCEDKDGNPVSQDSPDLIKPIRKEVNQLGDDPTNEDSGNDSYCCLACQQVFQSIPAFDEHVENNHNESITVVILGNMIEFLNWKKNIEAKTQVKYVTLSSTAQKQYFQCNYVSPQNSGNVTHLCPSVMILREFSKGIHVRYHKKHEHSCAKHTYQQKDTKSNTSNQAFDDLLTTNDDAYTKLKDLMKSIMQRASKLKSEKLKLLYKSALEMQTYLNSLDEESSTLKAITLNSEVKYESDNDNQEDIENGFKSKKGMTDDQIVKALEGTRVSSRLKRKSKDSPTPEPKLKLAKTPETNKGLKENNSHIDLACKERFESPKPNIRSPYNQSPSFNDTYKQFIDSTVPKIEKQIPKKPKKEIVKTKMGQFTPSPKREEKKVKFDENVVTRNKKKSPVKSLENVKLEDVEYEVIEQENDCNILVLKI